MVQLTNRNRALVPSHARLLVPLTLVALALAGVTARPSLEARAARAELEAAKARLGEREREAALLAALRDNGSLERARVGLVGLRDLLPARVSDLLAHGALRESARRAGVELTGLRIGEPLDADLGVEDESLRALPATLGGHARLSQIVALVEHLKAFGLPAAVLEISVMRPEPRQDVFEFELDLWLLLRPSPEGDSGLDVEGTGEREEFPR